MNSDQRQSLDTPEVTSGFWQDKQHKTLLALTFPMILANITTPLIGLVDTAVLGHMQGTHYIAGASVAALILTQLYWVCGFLRMSATGLSAQARGSQDSSQATKVLCQSLAMAVIIGLLIVTFQSLILQVGLYFSQAGEAASQSLIAYFNVRVWGAPAALANLALVGWLLGQQRAKQVMWIQVIANLLNAGLDLVFVYGFGWSVAGVAMASVIAEYSIAISCLLVVFRAGLTSVQPSWFLWAAMKVISQLNSAMLVRNLALQACLIFMTFQGIRLGQQVAATNAILMQFFVLIALGLDAVAYAVEALVGEAKGQKSAARVLRNVLIGLLWSSLFALLYALVFWGGGEFIIQMLTDQTLLQQSTLNYMVVIVLLPIIAHWCFLLDGVYIGLTRARAMRDSMLLSALFVYFPLWYVMSESGNWALWTALLAFLAARGVSLGGYFYYLYLRRRLTD